MNTLAQRAFIPFLTFITLFLGTGFVAGSIVHMGEGINPWDLSLFTVGVILFIAGSVAQDIRQGGKRLKEEGVFLFLLLSLVLSIGIGMASGGIQHFDDTPAYSAVLIPLGIGIGFIAFILKERVGLSKTEWAVLLPVTAVAVLLLGTSLRTIGAALPDSLRGDHSHDTGIATSHSSVPSTSESQPHRH